MMTDILGTIVPKSRYCFSTIVENINHSSQGIAMPNDEQTITKEQSSKVYRGPRCGFCHGKMEVARTCEWNEEEGSRIRYHKCASCGLMEPFTERRGR